MGGRLRFAVAEPADPCARVLRSGLRIGRSAHGCLSGHRRRRRPRYLRFDWVRVEPVRARAFGRYRLSELTRCLRVAARHLAVRATEHLRLGERAMGPGSWRPRPAARRSSSVDQQGARASPGGNRRARTWRHSLLRLGDRCLGSDYWVADIAPTCPARGRTI